MKTTINPTETGVQSVSSTPDGVTLVMADGTQKVMGYRAALNRLDSGAYDENLALGMCIAGALLHGESQGDYSPTSEQGTILWRWIVAGVFVMEQIQTNGMIDVANEEGGIDRAAIYRSEHGYISIYPITERFSLASHVEAVALEKYGRDKGYELAERFYMEMTDVTGAAIALTQEARKMLNGAHDEYINMLNAEGIPAEPVTH